MSASRINTPAAETAERVPPPVSVQEILRLLAHRINRTRSMYAAVQCVGSVRSLLSPYPSLAQEVIRSNIGTRLATFLQPECDAFDGLQIETCRTLLSLTKRNDDINCDVVAEQTAYVVELSVVSNLIRLLESVHECVRVHAAWELGTIMGGGGHSQFFDCLGAVDAFMAAMKVPCASPMVMRNCVWALSQYCLPMPRPKLADDHHLFTLFASLLDHNDNEIVVDAAWGMSYLSEGPPECVQSVLDLGVLPRAMQLVSSRHAAMVQPALRIIGNIAAGDEGQTQELITAGVLPRLHKLLRHTNPKITKEACYLLGNIIVCSQSRIQAVIVEGLFPAVFKLMHSRDLKTKREAVWVVCNASAGGSVEQVRLLVEAGALRYLIDVLSSDDADTVIVALATIDKFLKKMEEEKVINNLPASAAAVELRKHGGLTAISNLMEHVDQKSERVQALVASLQKYVA